MSQNNNSNNLLIKKFQELSKKNESALICYALAGYPDIKTTKDIISTMVDAGADIIEIGIPFSDPIADGPTIQEASYNALIKGITPPKSLDIIHDIKKIYPQLPLVAMTYSNILVRVGFSKFMQQAKQCGIDGFILADMPIEESEEYIKEASNLGLATIFMVSPNTKEQRIKSIASKSSGFLYVVSVIGITGMRESFEKYTANNITRVKEIIANSGIPVAVGFGISNPSHCKYMINAGADAIIVASAIINIIEHYREDKKRMLQELQSFVLSMKNACSHYR
ncbi:MAG TPA: tryptophan synthase subunit alpha [Nitrososphaeraceae archaeon]|nr:tryptophan synthase subunit alpha [Nitrososphaeraceae archaeon]